MKKSLKSKLISRASILALAAVILSTAALCSCGQNSGNGLNSAETNLPSVNAAQPDENQSPSVGTNADIGEDGIFNNAAPSQEANATISGAVVVYKSVLSELDKCSFACVGDLNGSGDLAPFTFAVPLSDIVDEIGNTVDPQNEQIVSIDIEFGGEIMETYPAQLGSVKRIVVKSSDVSKEEIDEYEKMFNIDDSEPDSCEQTAYIVDNAYVIRTEEMWDGQNVSILAYAQMGTCGIKDLVEIVMPKSKVLDENNNQVNISDITVGRCIEFAYTNVTQGIAGSTVFNVDVDYLTVTAQSVEVSDETIKTALDAWEVE